MLLQLTPDTKSYNASSLSARPYGSSSAGRLLLPGHDPGEGWGQGLRQGRQGLRAPRGSDPAGTGMQVTDILEPG